MKRCAAETVATAEAIGASEAIELAGAVGQPIGR